MTSQVCDTNEKKFLFVSQTRWINFCHGQVKANFYALHWIDTGQNKKILPSRFKWYTDMNPHILSQHYHQIILYKIEGRKNLNNEEYAEDENYCNVDSDNSDDDDNQ